MRKKLTLKQTKFVGEYLKDGNATRAVREAYPNVKSDESRRVIGSKLLTNANVQEQIEQALSDAGLTPELIATQLAKLVNSEDESQQNKAIRTAAEMYGFIGRGGLMATQVNVAPPMLADPEELYAIRERLKAAGKWTEPCRIEDNQQKEKEKEEC